MDYVHLSDTSPVPKADSGSRKSEDVPMDEENLMEPVKEEDQEM